MRGALDAATCKTPGCNREPLRAEIIEILGAVADGLCELCAARLKDPLDLPCTPNHPSRDAERVADQCERDAYLASNDPEEVLKGRLAQPPVMDDGLADLRELYEDDKESNGRVLFAIERRIVDAALRFHGVRCARIAAELGVHRSTVWRHVQRLRSFVATRKPLTDPEWDRILTMAATVAGNPVPPYSDSSVRKLDLDSYNKAATVYKARRRDAQRRHDLSPTIYEFTWRGGKRVITGPGPLPPSLQDDVRTGKAERIYDPPRCYACGRYLSRSPTGRPPKYCGESCRSRYRRRR